MALLPGGSAWTFSPGQNKRKENYFRREMWENLSPLNSTEYYEKLKETFSRILPRYFRGKERIAVSLTGGVDTRMIMAWLQRQPGDLPCYTFGGMLRDCTDVKIARQVAKICQQPHHVITVGHEFLANFPSLAEKTVYITDGLMDVSGAADLYVNQVAREIAPVRMTGNYGGEILRSTVAFKPISISEGLFEQGFGEYVQTAAQTYFSELNERKLSFVTFKQVPWHHYSRLSLEQSQLTLRSPYLDNDLVSLAFQAPPDMVRSNEISLRLIADGNPAISTIGTDRGVLYRPIPIVTRIMQLYQAFTFKAEYAYDYGMPNELARFDHMLAPLHLENLFLGRHKIYHFRIWYRDRLSQYLKDILLDSRTRNRPYLRRVFLEDIVHSHTKGFRNHTLEIHRLLTSELIQRHLIDRL